MNSHYNVISHEDRQEALLKHGLMIYQKGHYVTVSTIKRGSDTDHALAVLKALDTEYAHRVTAFLAYHKLRGTLNVIPDANA